LLGPEVVVVGELVERLADLGHRAPRRGRLLELAHRLSGQGLELDPPGLRLLRERTRRDVDRDAERVVHGEQALEL
jgi:hypothetical protein